MERIRPRTGGPAVNVNDQWWKLACGCGVFGIQGSIEEAVSRNTALGRKFDRLRYGNIVQLDHVFGGTAQHLDHPGLELDRDEGQRLSRTPSDRERAPGPRLDRRNEGGKRLVDLTEAHHRKDNGRQPRQTLRS